MSPAIFILAATTPPPSTEASEIKMFDLIAGALQYAYSSLFSTSLVIVISLLAILGIMVCLWGWLWNKKWGLFKSSYTDLFVCTLIALLFTVAGVALHGFSGNNFAIGITHKAASWRLDSALRSAGDDQDFESAAAAFTALTTKGNLSYSDAARRILSSGWKNDFLRDYSMRRLERSALLKSCKAYDTEADSEKKQALSKQIIGDENGSAFNNEIGKYEKWAGGLVNKHHEAALTLVIIWWSAMVLMLAYVAWRAFTNIQNPPATCKPSDKVKDWVDNAADANEDQPEQA